MIHLQEFRSKAKGMPDLLTYAALIDEGIILQKDGSFLAGWEYVGLDTASATDDELAYMSMQVSNAIKFLHTGFAIFVDAIRTTKQAYPDRAKNHFPDKILELIDEERREFFGSDVCFTTTTVLMISYKPDFSMQGKKGITALNKDLEYFKTTLLQVEDALSAVLSLTRLTEYELDYPNGDKFLQSDLLSHLQYCIKGSLDPFCVPKTPMYLDSILGGEDFYGGLAPKIGNQHINVISIDGLPQESYPAMMSAFNSLPFELRYSTRYICLDQFEAEQEINTYVKGWNQKVLGFFDQFFNKANPKVNRDALIMREDAEEAKTEVQSGIIGAGYVTSTLILFNDDEDSLHEQVRQIRRLLQALGFTCRLETINSIDAYLGSLPGNTFANVRRPIVNTLNLADLLPLSTIYTGESSCPSPFMPSGSRPLAVLTTENGTSPFWFNLHVGDLGHTLIFGPTGSGKSTLLALLAAQFPCYENAQVYAFDKGMSLFPLTKAINGSHYEIGSADSSSALSFAPLQDIDSKSDVAWAEDWIATLLTLQRFEVLPGHVKEIHNAILKLQESTRDMRSLTHFIHCVQDLEIKEALNHYSINGAMGHLLDATSDTLGLSSFVVFEMEELMNLGDKNLIPVLLYIFRRIEKSLDGRPTLLFLDEAWILLGHPVFRDKIREYLKVMRKSNCAVVLATQSLSDAKNSGILDVLVESCPTKILLANQNAMQEDQYELYKGIGLNSKEIKILSQVAQPKRDYYITSPKGKRLVQLALGKKTLAFTGASDKESISKIKRLSQDYPHNWQDMWLEERI